MHRSNKHPLLPLLVLGMTVAMSAPLHAQEHGSGGTSASLQVTFGTAPHWSGIAGTRVREIQSADRPGYDMFRYGNGYYVYNNSHWYTSRRGNGQFRMIDDRTVPSELRKVPRDHWRSYPAGWEQKDHSPQRGGERHS